MLREAGEASAAWVGLSMGAAVAVEAALREPGAVRALVLASIPAGRGASRGISAHAAAFAEAIEREGIEAAGARFAWGPGSGLDAKGAALVRQGFLEHPAHGLALTLRGFLAGWPPAAERSAELARIRVPALVVAGALDAASLGASQALAASLPDARLEVVPEAGHVVNLARPDAFSTRSCSRSSARPWDRLRPWTSSSRPKRRASRTSCAPGCARTFRRAGAAARARTPTPPASGA